MRLVAVLCVVSQLASAAPERKDPVAIKAEAAFRAERWADAAEGFERAYDNDPNPEYLFAWAQAERKQGACDRAVELYDAYILFAEAAGDVPAARIGKAQELRDECKALQEPETPLPPPPTLVAEPTTDDVPDAPEGSDGPRPWYRDPWGASLVGIGGGVLAAGAITRVVARVQSNDARSASSEGQFETDYGRSQRLGTTSIILMGTGAAVALAGVIRWVVVARRK